MKKMFLALALLAVAPIFAEEPTVESKGIVAKAKEAVSGAASSVAGYYSNAAGSVDNFVANWTPSFVSTPVSAVVDAARNNVKVAMALVAVATYAVVKTSESSVEAEL